MNLFIQLLKQENRTHCSRQYGFTLIEIMVASVLGIVILAGVMQIYFGSKQSFHLQNQMAELQQNQRIALEFLTRDIRMAGFTEGNPVVGLFDTATTVDGGTNVSDDITVTYASATDCLGEGVPGSFPIAVNRYFIQNETLKCQGNTKTEPLVDGVVNMQILYGINTDGPATPPAKSTANKYVRAGDSDLEANMSNVVSVRISLLFRTPGNVSQQATAKSYRLLDAEKIDTSDRIRRQVITTTILLRNAT